MIDDVIGLMGKHLRSLVFASVGMVVCVGLIEINTAHAQSVPDIQKKQGRTDYINEEDEAGKPQRELIFKNTLEFESEVSVEAEQPDVLACEASLQVDYRQKDTFLLVEAFLTNYTCGRSKGSYEITVEYVDEKGQAQTINTQQAWEKPDDEDLAIEHRYPMNFDSEIASVRGGLVSGDACFCVETSAGSSESGVQP